MKKTTIIVESCAPRRARRAAELFVDARFKPRVVKNKRAYTRRARNNRNMDQ